MPESRLRSPRLAVAVGCVAMVAHAVIVASLAIAVPFTTDEPGYLLAGHAIANDMAFASPQERLHGPLGFLANQWFVRDFDPTNPEGSRVAARLGTLPFSLLVSAVVWRWAHVLWGPLAGLFGLFLVAFSPTVLAYSALATVDTAFAATAFATLMALWSWCREPSLGRAIATGGVLGLCLSTKYLALLFAAAIPIVLVWRALEKPRIRAISFAVQIGALVLVAWTCLHATYGFRAGFFADQGSLRSDLVGVLARTPGLGALLATLPAPLVAGADFQAAASRDFAGGFADERGAHWAYYLVAVLTKTSLPLLCAFGLGSVAAWRARARWLWPTVTVPVGVLLGYLSLLSQLQIGIRYVLVAYPCMAFAAAALLRTGQTSRARLAVAGVAAGWVAAVLVVQWPHYLGYFNPLVGGPGGAYRVFADSNVDWGQRRVEGEAEVRRLHRNAEILRKSASPRFGLVAVYVPDLRVSDPLDPSRLYHWIRRFEPVDHVGAAWLVFDVDAEAFRRAAKSGDARAWHDLAIAFANSADLTNARESADHTDSADLRAALRFLADEERGVATSAQRSRAVQSLYALGATELSLDVLRRSDDAEQTQLFLSLWSSGDPERAVELLQRRAENSTLSTHESLLLGVGLFHLARFADAVAVLDAMTPPREDDPLRPLFDRFESEARAKHAAMRRLQESGR